MESFNRHIFESLFREACEKGFGHPVNAPLSETDSKLLSNKILEHTGLVIGAKSIKNYSKFIFSLGDKEVPGENPNIATLDTFARYVLDAPYTDEIKRKDNESHYPYWYQYKSKFGQGSQKQSIQLPKSGRFVLFTIVLLLIFGGIFLIRAYFNKTENDYFHDDFNSVSMDSLISRGWIVKSIDSTWWRRRNEKPNHITLFALRGDNWSLEKNHAQIKNLLMREIGSDCFVAEVHLTDFVPKQNWQQAGIILSENSAFTGKMIRLSIAYNDFFGGFEKPAEIILQALSSSESGAQSKPEEIIHMPLFLLKENEKNLAEKNLHCSALKIEKKGTHFKFLYSVSPNESFSFNKASEGYYSIRPRYISIFAIQGWASGLPLPAYFDSFSCIRSDCSN